MPFLPDYPSGGGNGNDPWRLNPLYQDYLAAQENARRYPNTGEPSRSDLNEVATPPEDTQAQVAAENAPLREVYGSQRIGAQIADVLVYQGKLVMIAVWCRGEIDSINDLWLDNEAAPGTVTATHYTGTAGQTADPTLIAAYAAQAPSVTYTDTLAGIAYSVLQVPTGASQGFPAFTARIKGRKVYDERSGLTEWSDNPALALADFLANTGHGMGRTVDQTTVATAADACDALVGGEKRRLLGLCLDKTSECRQWVEALRAYAGCWVSPGPDGLRLIPDRPAASVMTFTAANIVGGSFKLKKRGVRNIPTVVEVRYTDTTTTPWTEKSATAKAAGVDAGTTPRRESQVSLPGVQRYSQANREAIERLNHFQLEDLEAAWETFDEALALEVGDVVTVTHPVGLTAKPMRVTAISSKSPGRWAIQAKEYDPAAYSDSVESEPTWDDTTLPNPASPPAVTGLALAEEVYQLENGIYASRIRATWDAATYPYVSNYRVEVLDGATLIQTGNTQEAEWVSPAVQEGTEYTVRIAIMTSIGAAGAWASDTLTAAGKALIPGDVPSLSAFEVGGRVYLAWEPAVDLDIWRYRLKYGPVGGTYESALVVDLVDGLRYQTSSIPAGTWTVYCKAVDSIRQESTNAATVDVVVTLDNAAFLVDSYDHTNPTLAGMAEYNLGPTDPTRYFVTEDGVMAAAKFPGTASSYADIAASYHDGSASSWKGESEDFGMSLAGTWTAQGDMTVLDGAGSTHIELSPNATDWETAIASAVQGTGRFARIHHKGNGGAIKVALPQQTVRLDAIPREEVGSGTSSASGPTTITLENAYAAVKRIVVTPEGAAARIATYDHVLVAAKPPNGTFETDISGWALVQGTGTCSRSETYKYDGAAGMVFDSTTDSCAYGCQAIPVTPGDVIRSRAWVYSSGAVATGFYFRWNYKDSYPAGQYVTQALRTGVHDFVSNGPLSAGWQLLDYEWTVPAGVYWASLSFYHWAGMSGQTLAVDSVTLTGLPDSIEVYVFDTAGNMVANEFTYSFQGV